MGPLEGIRIIEIAGIGPGPFCAMLLSDLGAEVLRIDRIGGAGTTDVNAEVLTRGRRSVAVNLKKPAGAATVLRLVEKADALIEGFRPGVTERLGIGPDDCFARNPKLVYGRMTGWGQDGPLAKVAGHDVNYIALTGALWAIGRRDDKPVPPLSLVGDYGGGALYLAVGVLAALLEARTSGKGQVVDAAMVDGAASLMAMFYGMRASGTWTGGRAENLLDSGAHFYEVYETKDGKWVSIGSIEPQFYSKLLEKTGLDREKLPAQLDRAQWPRLKERLAGVFLTKTRDEWCEVMEGSEVCFAPVLSIDEAPNHPHNVARRTFVEIEGVIQPAPAPRFSRTPGSVQRPPASPGEHTEAALRDWGFAVRDIEELRSVGAVG